MMCVDGVWPRVRPIRPLLVHHDGQLVLSARKREPVLAVRVDVHRTRRKLDQELGQASVVEPLDISADRLGPLTLRQQCDRPGSVARDHREHAVVVALADAEETGQVAPRLALGEKAAEERGGCRGVEAAIERQRLRQRRHPVRHPFRRVGELHPVRALRQRARLPVKAPHHQRSEALRHSDRSS